MQESRLKVLAGDQGLRLDQYLCQRLEFPISRSRIQHLINAGMVMVNKRRAKANYKVKANDILLVKIVRTARAEVAPEKIPLEIVFEDADLLVINKPAGMVTHPAVGNYSHTLVNALLGYGCRLSTINGCLRPGIVHRLDKDTSGLIVVAKNNFTHRKLAQQFKQHTIERRYQAIVQGRISHNEGIIDLPIIRHPKNRQKMAVGFLKKGRAALTKYKVMQRYREMTLLELIPRTGRTHQLRVHLKSAGHPILGDSRYGRVSSFKRLALHATVLGFYHPRTERLIKFQSELPDCFKRLINSLK